jgi:CHAD domain-containing protein
MSHLATDEPTARAVAADLNEHVDAALDLLDRPRLTDEDVHEARKRLKMARASLRLLRPIFKGARYRDWNTALRDAARPLSAARDSKVLPDTLRMLAARFGEPVRAIDLHGLRRALNAQRSELARDVLGSKGKALAHSRRLLRATRAALERTRLPRSDDWEAIGTGIQRVYGRGRHAMAIARKTATPEAFHEWRKQVKYLRYQLEALAPIWPGMIGEMADQAHQLADYLGEEHDLSVLREAALAQRAAFRDDAGLQALVALIDRCQSQLREKSLLLGSRLYDPKPRGFANRFGRYWRDWQAQKRAT